MTSEGNSGSRCSGALAYLLLPPKILYITMAMVFYAFYLFRPTFITEYLQLNDREYGDISAIMALVSFVTMTLWGTTSDALGRHRLLLAVAASAMAGVFMLFLIHIDNHMALFVYSALLFSVYSFFSSGILPLTDYQAIKLLERQSTFSKDLYGKQRLWATVSYGVVSFTIGHLIKKWGIAVLFIFLGCSAALFVVVLYLTGVPDQPKPINFKRWQRRRDETSAAVSAEMVQKKQATSDEESANIAKTSPLPGATPQVQSKRHPLIMLISNPKYLFFLLVVFMTGSARAVMTTFLAKYLKERMGLDAGQVGNVAVFGIVLEVVILFVSPWFIRTIGIYWMLILAQLAMVLRCWAYVAIPPKPTNVYWVYVVELLKGVAFGLTQSAGVKLSNEAAPVGLQATAQALYTSVYSQLPAVFTAFAGGRLYKAFGPRILFYVTAIVSTLALVLFMIKYAFDGSISLLLCFGRRRQDSALPEIAVVKEDLKKSPVMANTSAESLIRKNNHK